MTCPLFLHGGGDDPAANPDALGPFATAVTAHSAGPLALVLVQRDDELDDAYVEYYSTLFIGLGLALERLTFITASPYRPLTHTQLADLQPAGLFVCGGLTPLYREALAALPEWTAYLHEQQIPYGGSSAGAAIVATQAIVGGWRASRGDVERQILFEGAGEGLRPLTVLPGLALLPCAVDVHASQWGTLSRLVQAVDLGLVTEGVAIDENTTLIVSGAAGRVAGAGHVFHARRQANGVSLTIHACGDEIQLGSGNAPA